MFSPFQRLHRASDFDGTGMGLAIAHRIVARHGGRIWAQAEVGRGARFNWTVELAPDYVEAWNNLGILLGEMDRPDEAISAYRRALSLAPDYPDALYNLAETLVARGELGEARRLWRAYLVVDPQSPFARIVRERLARL